MPVEPTKQDQQKLHNEITQIANQRFLCLTITVAIFGALFGPISKDFYANPDLDNIRVFLCTFGVFLCILWAIFWYDNHLLKILRIYTTYLRQTRVSRWESDWYDFRHNTYVYTKYSSIDLRAHIWIFGVLILVPQIFLFLVYYKEYDPDWQTMVNCTFNKGLELVFFVLSIVWFCYIWPTTKSDHWQKEEKKIMDDWNMVLKPAIDINEEMKQLEEALNKAKDKYVKINTGREQRQEWNKLLCDGHKQLKTAFNNFKNLLEKYAEPP